MTLPLARYAGLCGTLEFEVVGPSPVEWTACRVGGRIRPGDANVYLVTFDGLRADRVGAYGYEPAATPAFDALARRGTVFLNAFSPTHDALAAYGAVLGGSVEAVSAGALPAAPPRTLPERMREAKRDTAAYVNWNVLMQTDGLRRGFTKRRVIPGIPESADPELMRGTVFAYALGWVEYSRARPHFLWVQCRYLRLAEDPSGDLYDRLVALCDAHLGAFVDRIERLGLDPYAALVVTAPCGAGEVDNTHVPLIVVLPGCGQLPGTRVPERTTLRDLAPTLLEYLGMRGPRQKTGRSLLPYVGKEAVPRLARARESG
jgi:arylsulfatase A-like enzyme